MLDTFLSVAYRHEVAQNQVEKLASALQHLPKETLLQLSTGKMKLAFGNCDEWLDKYKGTPLFDEAVALEKADLEADIARQQARDAAPSYEQFSQTQDQIRLQKKMLDLKLVEVSEQNGLAMKPGGELPTEVTPAQQGAGALGDVPSEGVQDNAMGVMGSKTGSVNERFQKAAATFNEALPYIAGHTFLNPLPGSGYGAAAGGLMAERGDEHGMLHGALRGGAVGLGLGGLGALQQPSLDPKQKALLAAVYGVGGAVGGAHAGKRLSEPKKKAEASFQKAALVISQDTVKGALKGVTDYAKANPTQMATLAGGALGAGAGALAGGPDHRLSGALAGGAVGAGLGHVGRDTAHLMREGLGAGESLQTAGTALKDKLHSAGSGMINFIQKGPVSHPHTHPALDEAQAILHKAAEARFKAAIASVG